MRRASAERIDHQADRAVGKAAVKDHRVRTMSWNIALLGSAFKQAPMLLFDRLGLSDRAL